MERAPFNPLRVRTLLGWGGALGLLSLTCGCLGSVSETGGFADDGPLPDGGVRQIALCGNGVLDPGELCDPPSSCPTECSDGNTCTENRLVGSPSACNARCEVSLITACVAGDQCCPAGCDADSDTDCSTTCGDGVLDPLETCDPPESCPRSCDDGIACTADRMAGSPSNCSASCVHTTIEECISGDGCCSSGCDAASDSDCSSSCGDGVLDPGETCDPPSSCPTSCDDGNACTMDRLSGNASMCTASCTNVAITACTGGDGCCPSGCSAANDSDCRLDCTNAAAWPAAWATLEDMVVTAINARRAAPANCGGTSYPAVGAVTMNAQLRQAARCHTLDMGTNNFFSHTGSDGSDPGTRITRAGYPWRTYGENIAAGYDTVARVVQGWMDSPGHCRNIMNGSFRETGVGYGMFTGVEHSTYWTQKFGAR